MPDYKEKQPILDEESTWPLLERISRPSAAHSGKEILQRLEKTARHGSLTDSNLQSLAPQFTANEIIDQKYQIIELISRGNMGFIYRARHIHLDKIFAIKVLAPDEPLKEESKERFQREAHTASSLNHPNIINVHDFGILENGEFYLAMEYLEGESLADNLSREKRLDFHSALPIFKQICSALEYAHSQGVVHRDLKPSNIMLIKDYKGELQCKVIDFSIAKFTRKKPDQKTITKPGQIFGSPLYMSPEQCQGKKPDHRSDIYSLGCVMYEVLCGEPPLFGETSLVTIYKHVNELPAPVSQHLKEDSLPKNLEAVILRALAKQPEDRFQSASDLRQALESIQTTRSSQKHADKTNKGINLVSCLDYLGKFIFSILIPLLLFACCYFIAVSGHAH